MEITAHSCTTCGADVRIPTSAAWPERCPGCGASPLAVYTAGGFQPQRLSPVGSIDPMKAANAAIRGTNFQPT